MSRHLVLAHRAVGEAKIRTMKLRNHIPHKRNRTATKSVTGPELNLTVHRRWRWREFVAPLARQHGVALGDDCLVGRRQRTWMDRCNIADNGIQ